MTPLSCGGKNCTVPPPPPPSRLSPEPLTVATNSSTAAGCPPGAVTVDGGPTSHTATLGGNASLECVFRAPPGAQVTWYRVCSPKNCGHHGVVAVVNQGQPTLTFHHLTHNDTGLYFCRVEAGRAVGQSCGTFLRVRAERMAVPFLNIKEATKNRIITAEGVLLLLCAVGPGLLLLFRKRWANERLLQMKKALEEENLYEGLNLDECSMYEDISRGLQPTYQDVGSLHPADPQLEKP